MNAKRSLFTSCISLFLCLAMLLGTTFAWFTDVAVSSDNVIQAGSLDIALMKGTPNGDGTWNWVENNGEAIFDYDKWEPGYTAWAALAVENHGTLAAKWQAQLTLDGAPSILADVIEVYSTYDHLFNPDARPDFTDGTWRRMGTVRELLDNDGLLLSGDFIDPGRRQPILVALHMREDAGNEYQGLDLGANFNIKVMATQASFESDSFGDDYDADAEWPELNEQGSTASADVALNQDGTLAQETIMSNEDRTINVTIPQGTKFDANTTKVHLNVNKLSASEANLTLNDGEETKSYDVHIDGVAADNTKPIAVTINEFLPIGLNSGNFSLHHVENGNTVTMTLLSDGETPVHNSFSYDPVTGNTTLYLASFSEVAVVANTENAWNGDIATSFAGGTGSEDDPYIIATADQLAYMNQQVSNDASYASKCYKLVANVNFGGYENYWVGGVIDDTQIKENVFYPIGYWAKQEGTNAAGEEYYDFGNGFSGTFDGNGNTISGICQRTWDMDGNYDNGYWDAAMGLFGYVNGGTVKNLTIRDFESDGEFTPTGCVAAYARAATFENIALVNCNPRVYNTGNGGIVGILGSSDDENTEENTSIFRNITVDNSNTITALWGTWDGCCGGIAGMYRGRGPVKLINCHVGAKIDAYNDVCGNYQYYWYRYSGMLIAAIRTERTDENGYIIPDTRTITAENCTVHFGDWNNYYYCELVANSLASYTHDHQMSRLTQVDSVDVESKTVTDLDGNITKIPTSGRVNYVVVNGEHSTENATCYHFVNGQVWNHEDAGYHNGENGEKFIDENGDDKADLKEDKQHIYLPFNQVYQGWGWGVKNIPVNEADGVTILDRATADSVTKFSGKATQLTNGTTYNIGNLFSYIEEEGSAFGIINGALTVTVTNLDENGNVVGEFTRDVNNWADGTLTLRGTGRVRITIQDYYFCTPTSIDVNVNAAGIIIGGSVTDDTYVDSSNDEKDFSKNKETLNTYSSSFRSYFRVNVKDKLNTELFNAASAKVQLVLTVADGSVTDETTFTLKAYEPAAGVTDIDFSNITWSNVSTSGTYSGLHWNNGTALLECSTSVAKDKIIITLDYSQIVDYVDESGNILFAFGTNTQGLKVGSLENATEDSHPVFNVFVTSVFGEIVDDTYVDSGNENKEKDFSKSKTELNVRNTSTNYWRSYFRFNFSNVLSAEGFAADKANAKVTFTFAVTAGAGTIADDTTFTFYAFNVDEATDAVKFSDINWNNVADGATYEQLGFNNGHTTALVGKKTMSEAGNITYADGLLTITVNYSDIEDCMDANGNCIFGLTTSSTDLKVASMENEEFEKPKVEVLLYMAE